MPTETISPGGQIQDPSLAHDMALAEAPHRDEIAERNQKVADATAAATETVKNYVDNTGNVGPREIDDAQWEEIGAKVSATTGNRESLEAADEAAERAKQKFLGEQAVK